jgi:hypothetical protein
MNTAFYRTARHVDVRLNSHRLMEAIVYLSSYTPEKIGTFLEGGIVDHVINAS